MARLTKQEMLIETYRNQTAYGATEVVKGNRYEFFVGDTPYLVLESKPGTLVFEVLVLGGMAPKVAAFKSKRMAYVPIEGRDNWYRLEIKADRKDAMEAMISAVIGSTRGHLQQS